MHVFKTATHTNHILFSVWSPDIDMLFLLLKNAKDSNKSPIVLFDIVTGHTYRENSILSHLRANDEKHRKCI